VDANGFEELVNSLRAFTPRAEIVLEEVPAPQKLATYAFAFSADVSNGLLGDDEDEIASGRFVLLHEPGGQDTWEGEFRCVTFVRADVDPVMQQDPLLPEVGWSWFLEALEREECALAAPAELLPECPVHLSENSPLEMMNQRLKSVLHGHLRLLIPLK